MPDLIIILAHRLLNDVWGFNEPIPLPNIGLLDLGIYLYKVYEAQGQ